MQFNVIEFDFTAPQGSQGCAQLRISSLNEIRTKVSRIEQHLKDARDELAWVLKTEGQTNGEFCSAREIHSRINLLEASRQDLMYAGIP